MIIQQVDLIHVEDAPVGRCQESGLKGGPPHAEEEGIEQQAPCSFRTGQIQMGAERQRKRSLLLSTSTLSKAVLEMAPAGT